MRKKIQLLLFGIFVAAIFISMNVSAKAAEQAPPANAPAAGPVPGAAPAQAPPVAMDPNAVAVLPTDSFDFGTVYEGNEVFHDFIIKNEGTADLKIVNVKSG